MNRFIRNITTIFISITFLISSIGVRNASPCCEGESKDKDIIEESSCCDVIVEEISKESCCEQEEMQDHICQTDCDGLCFTTYSYVKLDIDQIVIQKQELSTTFTSEYISIDFESDIPNSNVSIYCTNKSPPKPFGKPLIISLNQLKIPAPLSV